MCHSVMMFHVKHYLTMCQGGCDALTRQASHVYLDA